MALSSVDEFQIYKQARLLPEVLISKNLLAVPQYKVIVCCLPQSHLVRYSSIVALFFPNVDSESNILACGFSPLALERLLLSPLRISYHNEWKWKQISSCFSRRIDT